MEPRAAQGLEWMETLLPEVLRKRVPSVEQRREVMGAVWEHCFREIGEDEGRLQLDDRSAFRADLERLVEQALAGVPASDPTPRIRSGAVGVYLDANLRELDAPSEPDPAPAEQSAPESHPILADALRVARERGDVVLQRNLDWMMRRDRSESYAAIAEESDVKEATVRTGVRRARQEVRRIAYERERSANAPHSGRCPDALRPARDAWESGELERAAELLAAAPPHPYGLYLSALVADDRGEREHAVALLSRVLVEDDDALLRAKVLNCLGCIADDRGELEPARVWWSRACAVQPGYAPAALNLLKNACDRSDSLAVHVALDRLGELLSGSTLSEPDRRYLIERLETHPDLGFARRFDAWRRGPARWIARPAKARRRGPGRARRATAGLGLLMTLVLPGAPTGLDRQAAQPATHAEVERALDASLGSGPLQLAGGGDRGARVPRPRPRLA